MRAVRAAAALAAFFAFLHIIPVAATTADHEGLREEVPFKGEPASSHNSVQISISEISPYKQRKFLSVEFVIDRSRVYGKRRSVGLPSGHFAKRKDEIISGNIGLVARPQRIADFVINATNHAHISRESDGGSSVCDSPVCGHQIIAIGQFDIGYRAFKWREPQAVHDAQGASGAEQILCGKRSCARLPLGYAEGGNREPFGTSYLTALPSADTNQSNSEEGQHASKSRGGVCDKFLPPPIIVFGIAAAVLALGFYIQAVTRTRAGCICGSGLALGAVLGWLSLLFGC